MVISLKSSLLASKEKLSAEEIPLQQRAAAASLLGKLVGQTMHGPRVAIALARFFPDGLVSIIRDGPGEAVVSSLEQTTETPELVWTPAMAASLSAQLATMASDLYREQVKGHVVDWDVPEQASGQQEMRDEPQVYHCTCNVPKNPSILSSDSHYLFLSRLEEYMSGYS